MDGVQRVVRKPFIERERLQLIREMEERRSRSRQRTYIIGSHRSRRSGHPSPRMDLRQHSPILPDGRCISQNRRSRRSRSRVSARVRSRRSERSRGRESGRARNRRSRHSRSEEKGRTRASRSTRSRSHHTSATGTGSEEQYNRRSKQCSRSPNAKRLIGRRFDETTVQRDIQQWPFKVIEEDGRPKIVVEHEGAQRSFFPEEISSMILARMKATAEAFLGATVHNAVVTVPAYFNDSQRQATKDAGTIAGLNVLRIINEPTAGALAYGLGDTEDEERNVLIFDLGGGTFDVSLLTIEQSIFEVRSTAGDTHLGGEDFDARLVEYFAAEFERRHRRNLRSDNRALRRLRTACERAKRVLSAAMEAGVELDALHAGLDFHSTVTRARFEELNEDLFNATLEPVRKALVDAQLDKKEIHEVVLVGGSTRIPAVQALLRNFFNDKELNQSVNPDEAVAFGAAIEAAVLDGDLSETIMDLVLVDVTPLSLGVEVHGEIMSNIIPRNTTIPTRKTGNYTTVYDNQTTIDVNVIEGERIMAKDNHLLGSFVLSGIPKAPRHVPKVAVTFEIDADGILHATAVESSTKIENSITITNDKGRLSKDQIQKLINEAESWKQEDEKRKQAAEAKNLLEYFCFDIKKKVGNRRRTDSGQNILDKCEETLQWMELHKSAKKSDYDRKKRELELLFEMLSFN